ncbi:cation:proton antiporter [Actinocorallia libanotica]|uniref:Na+/H+ antiporter n=1 Tax=Actinocorallia libanotica TaxID=46162 RepID=A0ABN1PZE6_9ACTN
MEDPLAPFAVIVVFLLVTVLAVGVGERIHRPYPVLVSLFGLLLALVPAIPAVRIPPGLILPLFLPPLIYAMAQRTSWRMLVSRRRVIVSLAVVLVLATVAGAAAAVHWAVAGISVAAAVAFGAAVSPPDPVAAEAVAGPLRLPRRLITILRVEGLCNDATALVIFAVAAAAVRSGEYSPQKALLLFCWEVASAVLLGLFLGWLATAWQKRLANVIARNALTLVFPFATYLLADRVHSSGVLAVLVVSLYLGQTGAGVSGVSDRLAGRAFWDTLELLITGLAFGLIGLELREVLPPGGGRLGGYVLHALLVWAVLFGLRFLWFTGFGTFLRRRMARGAVHEGVAHGWREDFVLAFCGMRGLATLALALALPLETPQREELLFLAFMVILLTLVLPGLCLPWVTRVLGVRAEEGEDERAVRDLALRASDAALRRLRELEAEESLPPGSVRRLEFAQWSLVDELCDPSPEELGEGYAERRGSMRTVKRAEADMLAASRREILLARSEPGVDPELADEVLLRLDLRSAHLI